MQNNNLEIERKFLIKFPDLSVLEGDPDCQKVYIMQLYLKNKIRIRTCETKNGTVYIKTKKQKITDITRIEIESEISKGEFESLKNLAEEGRSPIEKVRYKYSFRGKIFEIDIFPFWKDRAFLEIELKSEGEQFEFPPFIEVIKEVTNDYRYRNYSLAKEIPMEEI